MTDNLASTFAIVCAIYWAASVGLLLISVAATNLQPWLTTRRGARADRPPASIVLPVKLLEHGFERAEDSALTQNYPGFEAIAAAVDTASPAAEAIRAVFACFPHVRSRLLSSTGKFAISPKVDNLYATFCSAANDPHVALAMVLLAKPIAERSAPTSLFVSVDHHPPD